jgi:hypothetical protein
LPITGSRWLLSTALAAVPIALTATYEAEVYGAPWRLGYENLGGAAVFREGMSQGFLGIGPPRPEIVWELLVVPYRGLLVANPVVLMAIPAGVWAIRRRQLWEGTALATFGLSVLVISGYVFWDGGASIGPRHLLSALPLVFLASGRLFRGVLVHILTALSVGLMLAAVAAGVLYPPDLTNPWTDAILKAIQGDRGIILNWGKLALGWEGWVGFRPVMLVIALAWPWGDLLRSIAAQAARASGQLHARLEAFKPDQA